MQSMTYGTLPGETDWKVAIARECPNGYPMTIRNQDKWTALAFAVNQGIDSHLEGFTRSTFNASTGEVLIHPEELHTLVRRLMELDAAQLWPEWDLERESYPSEDLASCIMETLGFEWV